MSISNRLTRLADYIREKTGTSEKLTIDQILELMPKLGDENVEGYYKFITTTNTESIDTIGVDYYELNTSSNDTTISGRQYPYDKYRNENIRADTFHVCNYTSIIGSYNGNDFKSIDMSYNKLENIYSSFKDSAVLQNIEFPDSLKVIANSFSKCDGLESIKFGSGIEVIEESFYQTNPNTVIFPDKPILLNGVGFLEDYTFDIKNNIELYEDGFYVFKGTHILAKYDYALLHNEIINVPNGITAINQKCFENSIAMEINLPNTVVAIGYGAFNGCRYIRNITIPNSVKMIGCDLFDNCSMLERININYNNLEYIGISNNKLRGCLIVDLNNYDVSNIINENSTLLDNNDIYYSRTIINTPLPNVISNYRTFPCNNFFVSNNIIKIDDYGFCNPPYSANLHNIVIGDGSDNYISNLEYIGDHAFQYVGLESSFTILGNNVTMKLNYIGKYAFANNPIMTIYIPYSVLEIDDYAFYNCSTNLDINFIYFENDINQSRLERIGKYAFALDNDHKEDANMHTLNIPASVTEIDDYAFYNQSAIKTVQFENNSSLEYLGDHAFDECNSLISINIPEGITKIGDGAFFNCSSLTSVVIPEGVTEIGDNAFYGCTSLTSVTLPSTLVSIGKYAFYGCMLLSNIDLPESLTTLGYRAFYNCNSLTSITLPSNFYNILRDENSISPNTVDIVNSTYTTLDASACKLLMRSNYSGTLNIPEGITKIGDFAFYNNYNITSVVIPEGVTEIGDYAFYRCTNLRNINIPSTITKIGDYAFNGCSCESDIIINNAIIGERAFTNCSLLKNVNISGCTITLINSLFANCTHLINVSLPNNIDKIEYRTFYNCQALTSITIPESVTEIGDEAFSGCSGLTSIVIPEGVTKIGSQAFRGCYQLISVTIPEGVIEIGERGFFNCSLLNSVVIPESITEISERVFSGCSALTSVVIPEGVTEIGNQAFSGCSTLTSITIPESVTEIDDYTFYGCSALISVIIQGTINIHQGVFEACSALNNITIQNISCIGYDCFKNCSNLTNIIINSASMNSIIGGNAFCECTSLEHINIPEGVTEIGYNAFYNCSALTSVTIPESVTKFGYGAFYNCSALTTVYIPAKIYDECYSIFNGCENLNNIIITNNAPIVHNFYAGTPVENIYDILLNSIYVPEGAFINCNNLVNVVIPDNITVIGPGAFLNCYNLESVTFLNENIIIYDGAFSNCIRLTNVNFKNNKCKCIGRGAFSGCSSLNTINLPITESIHDIGNDVFDNCGNIEEIIFNPLTEEINTNAFSNCVIKRIVIPQHITRIYGLFNYCRVKYIYMNGNAEYAKQEYYSESGPIIYKCKYDASGLPDKIIMFNDNCELASSTNTSYPFSVVTFNETFNKKDLAHIRYINYSNLGTHTMILANNTKIDLKFIADESTTYSIAISNIEVIDNEAENDLYLVDIYDLTEKSYKKSTWFDSTTNLLMNLINNHEYYFIFHNNNNNTATCDVSISKYNGEYTEYINNAYTPLTHPGYMSLEDTTLHVYYRNGNIENNYDIVMNVYTPEDENDESGYAFYYGNLDMNPYAKHTFNCTENNNDFPFFMYVSHDGTLNICTEKTSNQTSPIIEITADIPEEVYDDFDDNESGGGGVS